jgi:hypothetical protein
LLLEMNEGGQFLRLLDSKIILDGKDSFTPLTTTTELAMFREALINSTQLPNSPSNTSIALDPCILAAKDAILSDQMFYWALG